MANWSEGKGGKPDPGYLPVDIDNSGDLKPWQWQTARGDEDLWADRRGDAQDFVFYDAPSDRLGGDPSDVVAYYGKPGGIARLALSLELRLAAVMHYARRQWESEREHEFFILTAPAVMIGGVATYFSLSNEPVFLLVLATCALFAGLAFGCRFHNRTWITFVMISLFCGGMAAGQFRTLSLNTPVLSGQVTGQIEGTIIAVSQNARGAPRYLIKPSMLDGIANSALPNLVRASALSKHRKAQPGEVISGLIRLQPFTGPAFPGGFDFGFNAWFDGLGGAGFFMGKPTIAGHENAPILDFGDRMAVAINGLRQTMGARIRAALPGERGDILTALVTGERTGIDRKTQESLRQSGLAHVLAISGMHMALVSLSMFGFVRFVLALWGQVSDRYPVKTIAAAAGFATATAYLLVSGFGIATIRAYIMVTIILLAVAINRKAITLRGVALAAMVIIILQPEAILSPGFHMSFAAVAAIVAAYEALDRRKIMAWSEGGLLSNRFVRFFFSLAFTSLVAGLATSLFAAWHFHRVAPYGLIANLLAMPVFSIAVMPLALIGTLLMPYGFEGPIYGLVGYGIDWVIAISDEVATRGGAEVTGAAPNYIMVMMSGGLFILTMYKSAFRWIGLLMLIAVIFFWNTGTKPDVLIAENGRAIAITDENGKLGLMYPRRNKFISDIWLRAYSSGELGEVNFVDECTKDACAAMLGSGQRLEVIYDPKLLRDACGRADILVAPRLRWVNCRDNKPSLILKRGDFEAFGSHALQIRGSGEQTVITVQKSITGKARIWNRHRVGRETYLQDN